MSFSSEVREELNRQYGKSRHCQIAEMAGMLEMEGKINPVSREITFMAGNEILKEKYLKLRKRAFGEEASDAKILEALRWDGKQTQILRTDGLLLQRTCCKRAFVRGAFMAAGSISNPNKAYHFEIVCRNMEQALQLQEIMEYFDMEAKIVERKERFVLYLKEGAQIVDMLNVMEASVSLMNLENVRILKEMRNSVNRRVNCETANINKTVSAAVRQIEDIRKIRDTIGFGSLPYQLAEIAQARLDHPDATLKELGAGLTPPVGKSGVNHRLRKLAQIAEEIP